ncbi:zinc finger domain protein [Penicillium malachiteum]|nr:zinc finger domain protein [Penicillium malachiteum]
MMRYLAIEDVCYNDLNWLEYLTGAEESPEAITQVFLANGLVAAHTAVKAESFERRKEILGPPDNAFKPTLELLIEEILEDAGNSPALYSFHEDDDLEFIKRPLWQENDPGPEESWRWAHQLEGSMDFSSLLQHFHSESLRMFYGIRTAFLLWMSSVSTGKARIEMNSLRWRVSA